jgi:large repetitive protein
MRRFLGLALTVLAAGAVLALGAPQALANHVQCGDVITQDTTLDSDLTCPRSGFGFETVTGVVIGADDITLDLAGHVITGPPDRGYIPDDNGVDNRAGYDHITIRNGAIRSFNTGINSVGGDDVNVENVGASVKFVRGSHNAVRGGDGSTSVLLVQAHHNTVRGINGGGIKLDRSRFNVIEDNSLGDDVSLTDSDSNRISHNTADLGIALSSDSTHNQIVDNTTWGTTYEVGIEVSFSDDNSVEDNSVLQPYRGGGNIGIWVRNSSRTKVRNNSVDQTYAGIVLSGSEDTRVEHNRVTGNGFYDSGEECRICLIDSNGNRVVRNFASETDSYGVIVEGNSTENRLVGNVANRDGQGGILIRGDVGQTLLKGNVANESYYDDGIHVDSPYVTLTRNTANDNLDFGIEAVPGVIDGGGNRASGNGNPLQCLNVFCKPIGPRK